MIHVHVSQLFMSNVGFVVLLKGDNDPRSLPIFIGAAEAQAIAIQMNDVDVPRPLTHDLLKHLLDYLECRLMRVDITRLEEGTFYANLTLEQNGHAMKMDCRPSDAISLALRCDAPIHVAATVMDEAGRIFEDDDLPMSEEGQSPKEKPSVLETMKRELAKSIEEERYEDAAKLRDEIRKWKNPSN